MREACQLGVASVLLFFNGLWSIEREVYTLSTGRKRLFQPVGQFLPALKSALYIKKLHENGPIRAIL